MLVLKYWDPSISLFLTLTYVTAALSGLRILALYIQQILILQKKAARIVNFLPK